VATASVRHGWAQRRQRRCGTGGHGRREGRSAWACVLQASLRAAQVARASGRARAAQEVERAGAGAAAASGRGILGDGKIRQPADVREHIARGLSSLGDGGRKEMMRYKGGTFSTGSCQELVLKVLLLGTAPPPPLAPV
jgi:hypothetical protein